MNRINKLFSAIIFAAITVGLASCSSEESPNVSDNNPKELTLTIMSTKPATKAALTQNPTEDTERTINRITVGIFSANGSAVRTIQEFSEKETSSTAEIAGTNKFYNDANGSATVKVVTTKMEDADKVAVAINAPENIFKGVQTLDEFKAVTISADKAIVTGKDGTSKTEPQADNIPMFEYSSANKNGTGFQADVQVKHLTAKVTLESLTVDFAANGPYSEASFTPTEVFLYSVPDKVKFNYDDFSLASPSFYTGESSVSNSKQYLSSGNITAQELKGDNTATITNKFSGNYYFYTTPNDNVGDDKTKLVIKGTFKKNATDTGTEVYYPVKLNSNIKPDGTSNAAQDGTTEYKVYPNRNYKCSITIKTIGSTTPSADIDPTTAEINITVSPFTDVNQSTIFQ